MVLFLASFTARAAESLALPVEAGDEVDVVPAGERGLVLYVRLRGAKRQYEVIGYDPNLTPIYRALFTADRSADPLDYDHDDANAWVLLPGARRQAAVMRTDLSTGETTSWAVPLARPARALTPPVVRADGSGGVWVAWNGPRHGNLTWVSPAGAGRELELGVRVQVLDLVTGPIGGSGAQAAIRPTRVQPDSALTLLTLDQGDIVARREVRGSGEERLLTGQALPAHGLVVGTYGPGGMVPRGASGMYVATFDGDQQTGFVTHPFESFDGFWEWLPDRKEARVEARAERRAAAGASDQMRLQLMVTEAVATPEGTVVVAEAFHPVYQARTVTKTTTDAQGRSSTTTTTTVVFVGWQFTHAIVAAFDAAGQRVWDHSVPLDRGLTRVIRPHVRLLVDSPDLALIYPYDRELRHSEYRDGQWVRTETVAPHPATDGVKLLEGDGGWWFGDTFLVWGTDKVAGEGRSFWFSRLDGTPEVPPAVLTTPR